MLYIKIIPFFLISLKQHANTLCGQNQWAIKNKSLAIVPEMEAPKPSRLKTV